MPSRVCDEWCGLDLGGLRWWSDDEVVSASMCEAFSFCFPLPLRSSEWIEETPLTAAFRRWCLRSRSLLRARTAEGARRAVCDELYMSSACGWVYAEGVGSRYAVLYVRRRDGEVLFQSVCG